MISQKIGEEFTAASGGRGGLGNTRFKSQQIEHQENIQKELLVKNLQYGFN